MNELTVFNYGDFPVRTIQRDSEVWWVLADICRVLEIKNTTVVAQRLDEDEVTKFDLGGLSGESNIINEPGLYSVILRSDKPEAKAFKRWVTHEVLPAIRATGCYSNQKQLPNIKQVRVGEVVQLCNLTKSLMEQQCCSAYEIAGAIKEICEQFGIIIPECTTPISCWESTLEPPKLRKRRVQIVNI